jgi:predicted ATPase
MAQHLQVKFIEEDRRHDALPSSANSTDKAHSLKDLKYQSTDWQRQLLQASKSLNVKEVETILAQIPDQYGSLRVALNELVYAYRFDLIIEALEALSFGPADN